MAPMNHGSKRSRERAETIGSDSESDDSSSVEVRSSNLRQNNHKKVRLSNARELSDEGTIPSQEFQDSSDDNEHEDEDIAMANGANRVNGGNEELEVEAEDYDPDLSDAEAERRYHSRMKRRKAQGGETENFPADNAIIEEIICTNFMCHENLIIKMGPLINFIIGHNGSGKSAVLTALTLCLGGKAAATNRGGSLKSFIKEGKDSSKLSVKIKNQGETAYKPDLYGPSIIVERSFNRNSNGGFQLKNASGKLVSSKKADLEDILDVFALQLDNPMNVLSQDMARQFLNASTPKDKYKLFYRGTHLEQLDSDYKILHEQLEKNNVQLFNLKDAKDAAKKKWEEADKKSKLADKQADLAATYQKYMRQMAWAQVGEHEDVLAELEKRIVAAQGKIEEKTTEAERMGERLDDAEQAVQSAEGQVQEITADLAPVKEEKASVLEDFSANKKELLQLQSEQRRVADTLKNSKTAIARINANIEKEQQRIRRADEGSHAKQMAKIADAKAKLEELQEESKALSAESSPLDRALHEARERTEAMNPEIQQKEKEVRECDKLIRELSGGNSGNWMRLYPQGLDRLLKAIEQEKRFREKPVGPMGKHIALLKPEWSSVLESMFGGALDAFAVTCKADENLLSGLMSRAGYRTRGKESIYITPSRQLNIVEPDSSFLTWLRVLKIDNPIVLNTFVIRLSIEQTALMESFEDARIAMGRGRLPNVKAILSFGVNRSSAGGNRWNLTATGSSNQSPVLPLSLLPRMQTDSAARLASEKQTLATLTQSRDDAMSARRELQIKQKEASQALELHKKAIKALGTQIQRQEDTVEGLQQSLQEETPQTGAINSLEEALQAEQNVHDMHEKTYGDAVEEKDKLNAVSRELKDRMTDLDKTIEELELKLKKSEKLAQKAENARHNATLAKNEAFAVIDDARKQEQQLQAERREQVEYVDSCKDQASNVSARVAIDDGETGDSLELKLQGLQVIMDDNKRKMGGDPDELMLRALEAKRDQEKIEEQFSEHDRLFQTLSFALSNRKVRWEKFRKYITIAAKTNFTYLLSERQFRGKLKILHEERTLDINVEPDITQKKDAGRQTKTLSGGEKSFSTICLLLSLWESMGSPIRCLDEFDVFMDSVNRDVSMRMMINAARNSKSRQFILITPQAMNGINKDKDVDIHRMIDPERGQTTLPFVRA